MPLSLLFWDSKSQLYNSKKAGPS